MNLLVLRDCAVCCNVIKISLLCSCLISQLCFLTRARTRVAPPFVFYEFYKCSPTGAHGSKTSIPAAAGGGAAAGTAYTAAEASV